MKQCFSCKVPDQQTDQIPGGSKRSERACTPTSENMEYHRSKLTIQIFENSHHAFCEKGLQAIAQLCQWPNYCMFEFGSEKLNTNVIHFKPFFADIYLYNIIILQLTFVCTHILYVSGNIGFDTITRHNYQSDVNVPCRECQISS